MKHTKKKRNEMNNMKNRNIVQFSLLFSNYFNETHSDDNLLKINKSILHLIDYKNNIFIIFFEYLEACILPSHQISHNLSTTIYLFNADILD